MHKTTSIILTVIISVVVLIAVFSVIPIGRASALDYTDFNINILSFSDRNEAFSSGLEYVCETGSLTLSCNNSEDTSFEIRLDGIQLDGTYRLSVFCDGSSDDIVFTLLDSSSSSIAFLSLSDRTVAFTVSDSLTASYLRVDVTGGLLSDFVIYPMITEGDTVFDRYFPNLDFVYESGYEAGFGDCFEQLELDDVIDEAYSEGYEAGFTAGHNEGYQAGTQISYPSGFTDGYNHGITGFYRTFTLDMPTVEINGFPQPNYSVRTLNGRRYYEFPESVYRIASDLGYTDILNKFSDDYLLKVNISGNEYILSYYPASEGFSDEGRNIIIYYDHFLLDFDSFSAETDLPCTCSFYYIPIYNGGSSGATDRYDEGYNAGYIDGSGILDEFTVTGLSLRYEEASSSFCPSSEPLSTFCSDLSVLTPSSVLSVTFPDNTIINCFWDNARFVSSDNKVILSLNERCFYPGEHLPSSLDCTLKVVVYSSERFAELNPNRYSEGFNNGYSSGYNIGHDEGYSSGYDVGYSQGFSDCTSTITNDSVLGYQLFATVDVTSLCSESDWYTHTFTDSTYFDRYVGVEKGYLDFNLDVTLTDNYFFIVHSKISHTDVFFLPVYIEGELYFKSDIYYPDSNVQVYTLGPHRMSYLTNYDNLFMYSVIYLVKSDNEGYMDDSIAYRNGYKDGFEVAYDVIYDFIYDIGYKDGYNHLQYEKITSWDDFIPALIGAFASFFLILLDVNVFGTNLLTLFGSVGALFLIVVIIKRLSGKY